MQHRAGLGRARAITMNVTGRTEPPSPGLATANRCWPGGQGHCPAGSGRAALAPVHLELVPPFPPLHAEACRGWTAKSRAGHTPHLSQWIRPLSPLSLSGDLEDGACTEQGRPSLTARQAQVWSGPSPAWPSRSPPRTRATGPVCPGRVHLPVYPPKGSAQRGPRVTGSHDGPATPPGGQSIRAEPWAVTGVASTCPTCQGATHTSRLQVFLEGSAHERTPQW